MNEKFITFLHDHQLPSKDEKVYCKYHNSWNDNTNSCWSFKNVIHDKVNKEVTVKFLGEKEVTVKFFRENEVIVNFPSEKEVMVKPPRGKEAMVIDEDPFPPATSINIAATNSRVMLNAKKAGRFSPNAKIRKVWIPKQCLTYKNDLATKMKVSAAKEK